MNAAGQVSVEQHSSLLSTWPRSSIAGSYGRFLFIFWEFSMLISTTAGPVAIPATASEDALLPHTPSSICCQLFCYLCHPDWSKMRSQSFFFSFLICISLIARDNEPVLKYFLAFLFFFSFHAPSSKSSDMSIYPGVTSEARQAGKGYCWGRNGAGGGTTELGITGYKWSDGEIGK